MVGIQPRTFLRGVIPKGAPRGSLPSEEGLPVDSGGNCRSEIGVNMQQRRHTLKGREEKIIPKGKNTKGLGGILSLEKEDSPRTRCRRRE